MHGQKLSIRADGNAMLLSRKRKKREFDGNFVGSIWASVGFRTVGRAVVSRG